MTTVTVDIETIRIEMLTEAANAANQIHTKHGDNWGACGFAWVTIYPKYKGNTREGKTERKVLKEMGFSKDWTGKSYQFWDPARYGGQNIDVKEAGARAAADVLCKYGFKAYAGSRLD
jgi:hypothetical protein